MARRHVDPEGIERSVEFFATPAHEARRGTQHLDCITSKNHVSGFGSDRSVDRHTAFVYRSLRLLDCGEEPSSHKFGVEPASRCHQPRVPAVTDATL